jgi:hypothetical protein
MYKNKNQGKFYKTGPFMVEWEKKRNVPPRTAVSVVPERSKSAAVASE